MYVQGSRHNNKKVSVTRDTQTNVKRQYFVFAGRKDICCWKYYRNLMTGAQNQTINVVEQKYVLPKTIRTIRIFQTSSSAIQIQNNILIPCTNQIVWLWKTLELNKMTQDVIWRHLKVKSNGSVLVNNDPNGVYELQKIIWIMSINTCMS